MFSIINLGVVGCFLTGVIDKINAADFTKLSFVIFIIFYIFVIKLGINIYNYCKTKITPKGALDANEPGWFASDVLTKIGMVGTVIGFIAMLSSSFSNINTQNLSSIQFALTHMSAGMSTALFTTAAGLICSLLLRIQLYVFEKFLKRNENV